MKAPAYWNSRKGLSTLLVPLSVLYETFATLHRVLSKPQRLPIPVICVGNLTAGGAGKTPVALAIGQRLKEKNIKAFFLSRGYGGSLRAATRVNSAVHTASEVGDEPMLLANMLPTVIAKDRLSGAKLAIKQGAEIIVMDDGFQNYAFHKTLSFIVIDGTAVLGNGRLLPAGPLREQPQQALKRAHAVIILNRTHLSPEISQDKPVLLAKTHIKDAEALKGKKYLAFCGIGSPQKFFTMLKLLGALIVEEVAFPDHHVYSSAELRMLASKASARQIQLITTGKDAVKLPAEFRAGVTVTELEVQWDTPDILDTMLDYSLGKYEKN